MEKLHIFLNYTIKRNKNRYNYYMQSRRSKKVDPTHNQENSSIFGCIECAGNQQECLLQINTTLLTPGLRKSRQTKKSLKNKQLPSIAFVPFQSELTLERSNTNLYSLRPKKSSEEICNKIDMDSPSNLMNTKLALTNIQSQQSSFNKFAEQNKSLRSTSETNFQLVSNIPKINFYYSQQQEHQSEKLQSNSMIEEEKLPPFPLLEMHHKISSVKVDVSPRSSEIISKNGEAIGVNSSSSEHSPLSSPLAKFFNMGEKELLISLQSKKNSNNSFQSSQRAKTKRVPSLNEPLSKGNMKVRQTVSIRSQEEQDLVSVVITNSMMGSFTRLLIPIDEHQMETKMSEYKEQ